MSNKVEFKSKDYADVMLTESDISAIINGQKVHKITPNGEKISISQSLMIGVLAPIIDHENKVVSEMEIDHIKLITESMTKQMMNENTFRLGD